MSLLTNLVAYWKLDETSGTRADETANNNDLADINTVLYGTGIINNGADFEYANSEYLSIADASQTGLDLSGDFSMSIWANFESLPSTTTQPAGFMAKYNSTGNKRAFQFVITETNKLQVYVSSDGTTTNRRSTNSDAAVIAAGDLGTLIHFACTFDVSTGAIITYKNASAVASTASNAGTVNSIQNNDLAFTMGLANQAGAQYMDGLLDEAGVWDRILTADEITELYNAGAGLAYPFTTTTANANFFALM